MNGSQPLTIVAAVAANAARIPDRLALIGARNSITYGNLWQAVNCYARELRHRGILPGDRVIVAASSTPEFVLVYLAIHLTGAIAVPVDPTSPKARVEHIFRLTNPKLAITSRRIGLPEAIELPIERIASRDQECKTVGDLPNPSQSADILFTTGTTGLPKGVVLSHGNLFHAALNINTFIGNTQKDVEVVPLPLCHSFGLARLRCNLIAGGCICLVSGFTFPQLILDAFERNKATGLAVVPAGVILLLKHDRNRLGAYRDQLRYIEIGSAPMATNHKHTLMRLLPTTRICMHYGLTEASRSSFIEFHADRHQIDSIGRPTPNVQIKIVGPDGKKAPIGQSGTIWVKGRMVMKEYYQNDDLTRKVLSDGWLNTGDWGHTDAQGYIFLEGREKELINVGGRKVAPIEVETLLNSFPGIQESACVAIPDPKGITGDAVKAFIVADPKEPEKPSNPQLAAFLRGHLEPYKIPVEVEWIAALPKTTSGKIQRLDLSTRHNPSEKQ